VSLTSRDRKLLLALIPIALVLGYWFLLLAPKRAEEGKVKNTLTAAQGARDTAAARLTQLSAAKRSFADDYQTVIRLGKSIPATLDMPSLIVQLNSAASGTGIQFTSIQSGQQASSPGSGAGSSTSKSSSSLPGLDSVPLTFEFDGDFFHLADFLHAMKRFVQVANNQIEVRGRLMTVDDISFKTQSQTTGGSSVPITASVQATVYLAPKALGLSAGATPQGPAGTTSSSSTSQASSAAAPVAAVTR
jgi:Tfp pilus assembly protein PilO